MKPLGGKNPASGQQSGKTGGGEEQAAKKQAATKQAGSRFEPLPVAMKRVQRTAAQKATAPAKDEARHEKSVETVEEDGIITKIIVTCSCGEVTEIECEYGDE